MDGAYHDISARVTETAPFETIHHSRWQICRSNTDDSRLISLHDFAENGSKAFVALLQIDLVRSSLVIAWYSQRSLQIALLGAHQTARMQRRRITVAIVGDRVQHDERCIELVFGQCNQNLVPEAFHVSGCRRSFTNFAKRKHSPFSDLSPSLFESWVI